MMSTFIQKAAAGFMALAAIILLAAPFVVGYPPGHLLTLVLPVLYLILAVLVYKGGRGAAWLGFFLMLFAGIVAMAGYLNPDTMPQPIALSIWGVSWLAALCLFIVLWRDKVVTVPAPVKKITGAERQAPKIM